MCRFRTGAAWKHSKENKGFMSVTVAKSIKSATERGSKNRKSTRSLTEETDEDLEELQGQQQRHSVLQLKLSGERKVQAKLVITKCDGKPHVSSRCVILKQLVK